jgi:LCP family protein required for cell wall assembly
VDRATRRKKSKKRLYTIISVITGLFIVLGGCAYSIYYKLTKTVETMHEPIEREHSKKRDEGVSLSERDPISILLIGVDERKNDRGRSDSLIVLTVNPDENSVKMVSIPRDTRTEIVGRGTQDKINHAYAYGGVEMLIDTVENFLDIPIDYYIKVNMESFRDLVDTLGGITVYNDFAFSYEGYTFEKGEITLNGNEALAYTRMRKQDPRGDFGRQDRQKQVIKAIIDKGASLSSVTKMNEFFNIASGNIRTNLTFDEIKMIQKNYQSALNNISQLSIKGQGSKINGIYYLIVPESERESISNELKSHLQIKG